MNFLIFTGILKRQPYNSQFGFCLLEAEGSADPVLVPWRYDVKPEASMSTNCFKVSPLAGNFDHQNHKSNTLGAAYLGAMNKLARQQSSKTAALVWEAGGAVCTNTQKGRRECSLLKRDGVGAVCFDSTSSYTKEVPVLNATRGYILTTFETHPSKCLWFLPVSTFAACQVQIQAGGSTPKIRPVKPKFYLMGCVAIKPSQWVKLWSFWFWIMPLLSLGGHLGDHHYHAMFLRVSSKDSL